MPMIAIRPFSESAPSGSGVSISRRVIKRGAFFQINLTAAAQVALFGRALDPKKDRLALSVNSDPGQTHILIVALAASETVAAVQLAPTTRGGVAAKCAPWVSTDGAGKVPPVKLDQIAARDGAGLFRLPMWARPNASAK